MSERDQFYEFYVVEEGMPNPRNNEIGWRHWDQFTGDPEGKYAALRAAKKLGIARVIVCRQIWISKSVLDALAPKATT